LFHIGELSRRTGVTADVIRAWERRYGLLTPTRSEGNFRLYSPQDVTRLRLMRHYVHQDISPSRAAALVAQSKARLQSNPGVPAGDAREVVTSLRGALERFEDAEAGRLLDRLVSVFTPAVVLRDVILPYLRELDEDAEDDGPAAAQERFRTSFLESWMLARARGRTAGDVRQAVLACVPGEHHALGLSAFAVALADLGWSTVYLGRDTPLTVVQQAADAVGADAIVLAATLPATLVGSADEIAELAQRHPIVLGGRATEELSSSPLAARVLPPELLPAARHLTDNGLRRGEELALQ
jgi:DNA-binding transcriptional MerR regulator